MNASGGFSGVLNIVRYNLRLYLASAAALTAAAVLIATHVLPRTLDALLLLLAAVVLFFTATSLAVSWFVYDLRGITRWAWIPTFLPAAPARWANIHAGLDESTTALRRLFPTSDGIVLDIYDPLEMSEPSIARARKLHPATESFLPARSHALPLPANDRDAVFLLFAAHEVRDPAQRTQLLREAARVLHPNGHVLLVEHLRDTANLLVFGPGAFHFHTAAAWRNNIAGAHLRIERQTRLTPFVHAFLLCRADAPRAAA